MILYKIVKHHDPSDSVCDIDVGDLGDPPPLKIKFYESQRAKICTTHWPYPNIWNVKVKSLLVHSLAVLGLPVRCTYTCFGTPCTLYIYLLLCDL